MRWSSVPVFLLLAVSVASVASAQNLPDPIIAARTCCDADEYRLPAAVEHVLRSLNSNHRDAEVAIRWLSDFLDETLPQGRPRRYPRTQAVTNAERARMQIMGTFAGLNKGLGTDEWPTTVLPVLQWFFENETRPDTLNLTFDVLLKQPPDTASGVVASLLAPPHPNESLVVRALAWLKRNAKQIPSDQLKELQQHHRGAIRQAAADYSGADVAPRQFRVPSTMLTELLHLFPELPAADAEWGRVSVTGKGNEPILGWASEGSFVSLLLRSWGRIGSELLPEFVKGPDDPIHFEQELTSGSNMDRTGGVRGCRQDPSARSILFAIWLSQRPDAQAEATAILAQQIGCFEDDRGFRLFCRLIRSRILTICMVEGLCGASNISAALEFASLIQKQFPECEGWHIADSLRNCDPLLMDGRVPTTEEWAKATDGMDPSVKIRYLLRLIPKMRALEAADHIDQTLTQPTIPRIEGGLLDDEGLCWLSLPHGSSALINPMAILAAMDFQKGELAILLAALETDSVTGVVWWTLNPTAEYHLVTRRELLCNLIDRKIGSPFAAGMDWSDPKACIRAIELRLKKVR